MVGSEIQKSLSRMVIKFDTLIRYYMVKLYKCLIEMNSISVNQTMLCGVVPKIKVAGWCKINTNGKSSGCTLR